MRRRLEKKYNIKSKSFDTVIEELKLKDLDIKAAAQKIKQFTERNKQYRKPECL